MGTKINPIQIDWDEVSTGTIVSGKNLGLDSNDLLVKASVSGGGGGGLSFDGSTANGVCTYKDSDEATVESNLTFGGSMLKVDTSTPIVRLDADAGTHGKLEWSVAGTRKWLIYNDHSNDNLTFKTDSNIRMTIAQTGIVTFKEGFAVGSDAAGDILYHNGTSYIRLAKGTADQVLTMNDGATAPGWETASGGGSSETALSYNFVYGTLSGTTGNTSPSELQVPAGKTITAITVDVTAGFVDSYGSGTYAKIYFQVTDSASRDIVLFPRGAYVAYSSLNEGTAFWGYDDTHGSSTARVTVPDSTTSVAIYWANNNSAPAAGAATIKVWYR